MILTYSTVGSESADIHAGLSEIQPGLFELKGSFGKPLLVKSMTQYIKFTGSPATTHWPYASTNLGYGYIWFYLLTRVGFPAYDWRLSLGAAYGSWPGGERLIGWPYYGILKGYSYRKISETEFEFWFEVDCIGSIFFTMVRGYAARIGIVRGEFDIENCHDLKGDVILPSIESLHWLVPGMKVPYWVKVENTGLCPGEGKVIYPGAEIALSLNPGQSKTYEITSLIEAAVRRSEGQTSEARHIHSPGPYQEIPKFEYIPKLPTISATEGQG